MPQVKPKEVKMLVSQTMFTLGTLHVYSVQQQENGHMQIGAPENGFYWSDAASPQGYGPFKSVHAAMEHYKWVIQATKGVQVYTTTGEKTMGTVIRVDFRNKKRVKDEL